MLYTISAILLVLWVLGLTTSTMLAGLIHLLLVIGLIVFVVNLLRAERNSNEPLEQEN